MCVPAPAWHGQLQVTRFGDDAEAIDGLGSQDPHVHRLRVRPPAHGIEACQPQEVLEQPPHPPALARRPA